MYQVQVWNGADYFTVENGTFNTYAEAEAFVNRTTLKFRQYRIV